MGGLAVLFYLAQFNLTGEPLVTVIASFGMLGILIAVQRKDFFLVGWLLVSLLTDTHAAPLFSGFPLTMLAAQGMDTLFSRAIFPEIPFWPKNWFALGVTSILTAYLFLAALIAVAQQANLNTLTHSDLQMLDWVKQNIPEKSRFLVLTGRHALTDPAF